MDVRHAWRCALRDSGSPRNRPRIDRERGPRSAIRVCATNGPSDITGDINDRSTTYPRPDRARPSDAGCHEPDRAASDIGRRQNVRDLRAREQPRRQPGAGGGDRHPLAARRPARSRVPDPPRPARSPADTRHRPERGARSPSPRPAVLASPSTPTDSGDASAGRTGARSRPAGRSPVTVRSCRPAAEAGAVTSRSPSRRSTTATPCG